MHERNDAKKPRKSSRSNEYHIQVNLPVTTACGSAAAGIIRYPGDTQHLYGFSHASNAQSNCGKAVISQARAIAPRERTHLGNPSILMKRSRFLILTCCEESPVDLAVMQTTYRRFRHDVCLHNSNQMLKFYKAGYSNLIADIEYRQHVQCSFQASETRDAMVILLRASLSLQANTRQVRLASTSPTTRQKDA